MWNAFDGTIVTLAWLEVGPCLDVWDAWSFFKLLDTDGGGSIELEEFFLGCLRLGGNARGLELGKVLQDANLVELVWLEPVREDL
eukprot:Skav213935  [mRNA]  locus=scaffold2679:143658:153612:- [translate_table: standard]